MRLVRAHFLVRRVTRRWSTLVLGGLFGCSNLTSPPAPEPIASDTPVTMATASAPHPRERPERPMEQPVQGGDLKIDDVVVGKGPAVKAGDTVTVHYTGTLSDGTKFDSSRDRGQPFTTRIPGNVIEGWNKGILGMRVGGKRHLVIPPSMGYGARPKPKIPPNSTLVFDVELLAVNPASAAGSGAPQVQMHPRLRQP